MKKSDELISVICFAGMLLILLIVGLKYFIEPDHKPTPFEFVSSSERLVTVEDDEEELSTFITVTGLPENAVVQCNEDSESLFGLDVFIDDVKYATCLSICGNSVSTVEDSEYLKEVGL